MKRTPRRAAAKKAAVVEQKGSDEEDDDQDFQDSGSEASIPDKDDSEDDYADGDDSDDDFVDKSVAKSNTKGVKGIKGIKGIKGLKSLKVFKPTPKKENVTKAFFKKIQAPKMTKAASDDEAEPNPVNVKDLTEQQKLLPEFLNLSESDSEDGEDSKMKSAPSEKISQQPLDFLSFVKKETPESKKSLQKLSLMEKIERLSESESEMEDAMDDSLNVQKKSPTPQKIHFEHLHEHSKNIEETRKSIELYNMKHRKAQEKTLDVGALLAMGEEEPKKATIIIKKDDDSESDDFEEVDESKNKVVIPKGGIQVVVDLPSGSTKQKKKLDLEMMLRRKINRTKKEYQMYMHKVHVLAWLGHGNHVNKTLNNPSIMASALSLVPSEQCYPSGRVNIKYVEQITKWYCDKVSVKEDPNELKYKRNKPPLAMNLLKQISEKQATSKKNKVLMFVSLIRALSIKCRLVLSFQVISLRPSAEDLCSLSTKKTDKKGETSKHFKKSDDASKLKKSNQPKMKEKVDSKGDNIPQLDGADDNEVVKKKNSRTTSKKDSTRKSVRQVLDKKKNGEASSTNASYWDKLLEEVSPNKSDKRVSHRDLNKDIKSIKTSNSHKKESKIEEPTTSTSPILNKRNTRVTKKYTNGVKSKSKQEKNVSQQQKSSDKTEKKTSEIKANGKNVGTSKYFDSSDVEPSTSNQNNRSKRSSIKSASSKLKPLKEKKDVELEEKPSKKSSKIKSIKKNSCDDSDFEPKKKRVSRTVSNKIDRRVLSTDDEHSPSGPRKNGVNAWCEIYVEEEEQWISVDVIKGQVHCVNQIYTRANHPMVYVVSWDNAGHTKDITQRYVPHWNTVTRKLRVEPKWFEDALNPWLAPHSLRDRREDEQLSRLQLDAPLPSTVSEFKNHPLYALKRHLLKFEVIYPPDAVTLGFVKNEAVYARECVYVCRSRETWVKEAKVVKPGEKPYKIVKARPKYDRLSGKMITDIPLEVFGPWQVQDYVPPTAENGLVPRNPYGNVELFKPCMLPGGTVHLVLPGLNKVAKKLGIDCAPAMVGFDYHSGWSHPVYDGFVVCAEFQDQLVVAWEEEQEAAEQRANDKVEKRVYGNWKKLIKGLLIRERLQKKYDFQTTSQSSSASSSNSKKRPKNSTNTADKKQKIDEK